MKNKLIILKDLYQRIGDRATKDQMLRLFKIKDDQAILNELNQAQKVQYALKCARSVVHLIKDEQTKQKTKKCLSLVEQWLSNPSSVSNDQLYDAARCATDATYRAAGYAAGYAANAAHAAGYAALAAGYAVDAAPDQQAQIELNFKFLMETI